MLVVWSHQHAHHVRDNQSYKAYAAADADTGCRCHGRNQQQYQAVFYHRHAHCLGLRLAQSQDIQVPCHQQHNGNTCRNGHNTHQYMLPAAIVQAADSPEKILLQLVLIHNYQQGSCNGTQQHSNHYTGQQQCQHGNPAIPGGKPDSQEHGTDSSYKGKCRHGKHVHSIDAQADSHHGTHCSTAGYANNSRVCQRVAENPLQNST